MVALAVRALVCALALLASPAPVLAQGDQGTQPQPGERKGIESLTITARKVETDIQSTADAVTAFSTHDLELLGIDHTKGIGRITPNVRFENVPGTGTTATVTIRGVSQADLLITGDPSVGIYTDGVYNARLVGGNFAFFDVERVEILKGPQGTLYGKNTPAGAINVWSRRPDGSLGGSAKVTYGSDQRYAFEGAASFPILGEQLSGRVAFLSLEDDGYVDVHNAAGFTTNVGDESADQNGRGGRLSLLWNATDGLEIVGQGYRYRERRHAGFPRDYYTAGVDFGAAGFGYATRYWAPGRKIGVELTYRFGSEAD
jgi:iron complex outermembrane receptor protein